MSFRALVLFPNQPHAPSLLFFLLLFLLLLLLLLLLVLLLLLLLPTSAGSRSCFLVPDRHPSRPNRPPSPRSGCIYKQADLVAATAPPRLPHAQHHCRQRPRRPDRSLSPSDTATMFTTFTGSSRRPRNVNLSGQRNTNPWANSTWGGPAPSGASKSVAQAQADREKRQREREELAAAKKLQRVWRGHRQRREAKVLRCQRWDHIYQNPASAPSHGDTVMSDGPDTCDPARAKEALPLLLALFNPAETDDQQRLDQWARDMVDMDSCQLGEYQWGKLAGLLVAALEKYAGTLVLIMPPISSH